MRERRAVRSTRVWLLALLMGMAASAQLPAGAPAAGAAGQATWSAAGSPDEPRRQALLELLHQDCGSCHGMRLTGGLGPPLTAAALAGKPAGLLRQAILQGRPGTPMPPWAGLLAEDEVSWLVHWLMRGTQASRP